MKGTDRLSDQIGEFFFFSIEPTGFSHLLDVRSKRKGDVQLDPRILHAKEEFQPVFSCYQWSLENTERHTLRYQGKARSLFAHSLILLFESSLLQGPMVRTRETNKVGLPRRIF